MVGAEGTNPDVGRLRRPRCGFVYSNLSQRINFGKVGRIKERSSRGALRHQYIRKISIEPRVFQERQMVSEISNLKKIVRVAS